MITIEEDVHFYDTDCGAVVHNLAYLRMVEKARTALFRNELSFGPAEMTEQNLFPAVTRTEADYLKPAKLGDRLKITGKFEEIGKLKLVCAFEIHRDDTLLLRCRQTTVLVQMPEGRPKRVPEDWRNKASI